MFKVLLVDDDMLARTRIKTLIEWEKNGFEICGEAYNGINAIQAISELLPDIVITDMSMPVMDGIELIKHIEINHPHIKVIALSGYNDFNYVRSSLKSGAVDYILKHLLDADALIKVLEVARGKIVDERHNMDQEEQAKVHLIEGKRMARRNIVIKLLNNSLSAQDELGKAVSELRIDIDFKNLVLVIAEIDDFMFLKEKFNIQELDTLLHSLENIATDTLEDSSRFFITHIENGRFVIIYSIGSVHSYLNVYNKITASVSRLKQSIKRYLNITASFSISDVCNDIEDIHQYYTEAEKALKDKFFKGKDNIHRESREGPEDKKFSGLDISDERKLIKHVKALEKSEVCNCINDIFQELNIGKANIQSVQMVCAELINIVNRIVRESGKEIGNVYSNDDVPYNKLQKYETLTDIKQWVLNVYDTLLDMLKKESAVPDCSENISKVIEFININFRNDISLNDAASLIGVHGAYLSRLFKEECGKGFIEYLNYVRLERARFLIEDGSMRLKDVVSEAGFSSYNYFFKVFKDTFGMTPLEYEKKLKNL